MKKHLPQLALAAGAMLALGVVIPAGSASAQTLWVADGVRNWNVAANWSAGVPNGATDAQINNGGTAQLFDFGAGADLITLGHASGNSGTLAVSAGDAFFNFALIVGRSGAGALRINNGRVDTNFSIIGAVSSGTGTATIDGANSTWINSGDLDVGSSGDGTLSIAGGGMVSNTHGFIGRFDNSIGTATVAGSNSRWTNSGDLNVGLFGSGDLTISGGGKVSNDNGYIGAGAGSSGTAIIVGTGAVWTNSNELAVGSSGFGELYIGAGGVVSSTIGYIGRYAGSSGSVLIDGPGSSWNTSGEFRMGVLGAFMGTSTSILTVRNGGVLSAAGGMTVGTNGTLQGDGTIVGNVLVGGGTIAPGYVSPGTLHITGDYTHYFGAKMLIDLASPASFDKLAVTGNINLVSGFAGSALYVSLADGYVPHGSQSFDILDWGGALSGTFLSIQLPTLGGTLVWDTSQLYTNGRISVVGPAALAGDYNQNGTVDAADYTVWRDAGGTQTGYDMWCANFGATLGRGSNDAPAIPEPATSALLLIALASAFCIAAYRKQSLCALTIWNTKA